MLIGPISGFEWDRGNRQHCQAHGVSIAEIETLFRGVPRVAPDPRHADQEDRFIAIGRNAAGRWMFVVFTIRMRLGIRLIRPMTARYMHAKEVRSHEAESS
jgi:uncharacterized DUF497 family protein